MWRNPAAASATAYVSKARVGGEHGSDARTLMELERRPGQAGPTELRAGRIDSQECRRRKW